MCRCHPSASYTATHVTIPISPHTIWTSRLARTPRAKKVKHWAGVIVATLTFGRRMCLHALRELPRKVCPRGDYILGVLLLIDRPVLARLFWSCRNLRLVGPGVGGILRNRPWMSSLRDGSRVLIACAESAFVERRSRGKYELNTRAPLGKGFHQLLP